MRTLLRPETTEFQYTEGAPDERRPRVGPDPIAHDQANIDRAPEVQLDLLGDYGANVAAYPQWQAWLRQEQPPLLVVWGANDPLFAAAGAHAFARDVPEAKIRLFDTGHFALETHGDEIASEMLSFLDQVSFDRGRTKP